MAVIKKVLTASREESDKFISELNEALFAFTGETAKKMNAEGSQIVFNGLFLWIRELVELDPAATSRLLRAYLVLADSRSSVDAKQRADRQRSHAARQIWRAMDLEMAVDKTVKN